MVDDLAPLARGIGSGSGMEQHHEDVDWVSLEAEFVVQALLAFNSEFVRAPYIRPTVFEDLFFKLTKIAIIIFYLWAHKHKIYVTVGR
jgi:hypothetical protein